MKLPKVSMHNKRRQHFAAFVASLPDFRLDFRSLTFWRNSFLIFMFFSLAGHFMEFLWWLPARFAFGQDYFWHLFPLVAEPYGFGVLAVLWLVYPLVRAQKLGSFSTYVLGALITTAVEFLCAFGLVLTHDGVNPYWDYSHLPFNLFGFVTIYQSIAFGFLALIFVYFLFPWFDHKMERLGDRRLNIIALTLAILYGGSLIVQLIFGFQYRLF